MTLAVGQRVSRKNPVPGWPDLLYVVKAVRVKHKDFPDVALVRVQIPETGELFLMPEDWLTPTQRHIEADVEQLPLFAS